jgi:hypothetical protein
MNPNGSKCSSIVSTNAGDTLNIGHALKLEGLANAILPALGTA